VPKKEQGKEPLAGVVVASCSCSVYADRN